MYQLKNLIDLLIGYGKKSSKQSATLKSSGFTPRFIKTWFYYILSFNYWAEEISKAIRFKTKKCTEKSKEKYSDDVKIVKVKVSYLIEVMD